MDATAAITKPGTKGQVFAWGLWDWGSAAFNAVMLTFVFSVYLTDAVGDDLPGSTSASTWFAWSLGIAGFVVAVLAPVTGQRADAGGHRRRSLAIYSRSSRSRWSACSSSATTTTTCRSALC